MLAVIAGKGLLPVEACKSINRRKEDFFVISFFPEDNIGALQDNSNNYNIPVIAKSYYKAGEILDIIHKYKTKKVLLVGKFEKKDLLKKIKLDWFGIKLFAKLSYNGDQSILRGLTELLEEEGIEVIHQDSVLGGLIVKPGILAGKVDLELQENIDYGLKIAQMLSENDIGQTVVVKNKRIHEMKNEDLNKYLRIK